MADDVAQQKQSTPTSDPDLRVALEKCGLEIDHWLQVLECEFKITKQSQLKYLNKKDIKRLKLYVAHKWQGKALNDLFDSVIEQKTDPSIIQNRDEVLTKMSEASATKLEAKKMNSLYQSMKEGIEKDPDKFIKKSESFDPNTVFNDTKPDLPISIHVQKEEKLDDINVVNSASAGQLLRGVFLCKDSNVKLKSTVIEIVSDIRLKGPSIVQEEKSKTFTSRTNKDNFDQSFQSTSKVIDSNLNIGIGSFGLCIDFSKKWGNETDEKSENHLDHVFHSKTKFSFVPVKSIELHIEDFRLTQQALKTLTLIETSLERKKGFIIIKEIWDFFERFGTHVNVGVLHLGGIYKYTATYESSDNSRKKAISELTDDALQGGIRAVNSGCTAELGLSISGKILKAKGLLEREYNELEISNVSVELSNVGGPPAANMNLQAWKNGLVEDPSLWAIISGDEFTGIWKVLENHTSDFSDSERLAEIFECAWIINNLGLQEGQTKFCDKTLRTLFETMSTMDKLFNNAEFIQQYIELDTDLQCFLNTIPDQYQDSTLGSNACIFWASIRSANFVKGSNLMTFLEKMSEYQEVLPSILSGLNFRSTEHFVGSLRSEFMRQLRLQMNLSDTKVEQYITREMTSLCTNLLRSFKETNSWEYLCLSCLLTKLYFDELEGFPRLLTIGDIDKFVEESDSWLKNFKLQMSNSTIERETNVLIYVIKLIKEFKREYSFAVFERSYGAVRSEINENVKLVVENFITQQYSSWDMLIANLNVILKTNEPKMSMPVSKIYDAVDKTPKKKDFTDYQETYNFPKELLAFLTEAGFDTFLTRKLEFADVISIKPKMENRIANIVWHFIECIFRQNSSIYSSIEKFTRVRGSDEEIENKDEGEDDFNFLNVDTTEQEQCYDINPLDLVVAVFACSSGTLKEILVSKMHQIGLAVPVLLPNTSNPRLDMDILRLVTVPVTGNPTCSILNCRCLVLSFIRIGRPEFSKGKLINEFIQKGSHDIFVNYETPLAQTKRRFSNGTVELSIFTTSFDSSNKKTYCAVNLRGDAFSFPQQSNYLSMFSNAVIVLASISKLLDEETIEIYKKYASLNIDLVVALEASSTVKADVVEKIDKFNSFFPVKPKYVLLSMKGIIPRSFGEICGDIKKRISKTLQRIPELTLTALMEKLKIGFPKQEEIIKATEICNILMRDSKISRSQVVPLQMEILHELSRNEKRLYNPKEYKTPTGRQQIREKIRQNRISQLEKINSIHDFMVSFIGHCIGYYKNDANLVAFASGVKHSLQIIEDLATFEMSAAFDIWEPSLSFEHVFRELGQIYDAVFEQMSLVDEETLKLTKLFPCIAARLLCHGFPLEIINGEIIHVNSNWIKAVIDELLLVKGDMKCLIISVVGIQSSGKSTLLNTMFGLRFPVGNGRVTKGAFLQLIPVDDRSFPFECILVIDTEGLRAPELGDDNFERDNGFATFIMGIADVTIINISGEYSKEMNEILQMVVYSLLRLRLVNDKMQKMQSCVFTHRNVASNSLDGKLEKTMQSVATNLDNLTKKVADLLNIEDVNNFNDVIRFNHKEHAFYLPELLAGKEPIKYTSQNYSKKVDDIKKTILKDIASPNRAVSAANSLNLSHIPIFIQDVWSRVMGDKFALQFKNGLEVRGFTLFDRKFHEIIWRLERDMNEFIQEKRCLLVKCLADQALEEKMSEILTMLRTKLNQFSLEAEGEIEAFIKCSDLRNIMEKYKDTSYSRKDVAVRNELERSKDKLKRIINEIKGKRLCNTLIQNYKETINREAFRLAKTYKGKDTNNEELIKVFNDGWKHWMTNVLPKDNLDDKLDLEKIKEIVRNNYVHPSEVIVLKFLTMTEGEKIPYETACLRNSIKVEDIEHSRGGSNKHVSVPKSMIGYMPIYNPKELKEQTLNLVQKLFGEIENYFTEMEFQDARFDESDIGVVVKMIDDCIKNQNEGKNNNHKFKLTGRFKDLVLSKVLPYCTHKFIEIKERYDQKHSPKFLLGKYKPTAQQLFTDLVNSKVEDELAADLFLETISDCVKDDVMEMLPQEVESIVLNHFKHSKYELQKAVMKNLAEVDTFDSFNVYLNEPEYFVRKWLINYVNSKILFLETNDAGVSRLYDKLFIEKLEKSVSSIKQTVIETTNKLKGMLGNPTERWLLCFVEKAETLSISVDKLSHVNQRKITDIVGFQQAVLIGLDSCTKKFSEMVKETTVATLKWKTCPYFTIFDKLWGCRECCPFCNEPCEHTEGHLKSLRHSCRQHRPQAIGDFAWNREKLVSDICSSLITTRKTFELPGSNDQCEYRHYKQKLPDWEISESFAYPKYWIWFFLKYNNELSRQNKALPSDIPKDWPKVNKKEAIDSL